MGGRAPVTRALGTELIEWFVAPALFLLTYVGYYGAPPAAIAPHLRLVLAMWASLALFRVALGFAGLAALPRQIITTAGASVLLITLLLYYALVVIGLASWGRVISLDLIRRYWAQAMPLAEALGVSIALTAGILAAACLAVVAATWFFVRRFDWTLPARRNLSSSILALLLSGGTVACVAEWYSFVAAPYTAQLEPLSLTFFFDQASQNLQGQALDPMRAEQLDRVEDAARDAYQTNPGASRRNVVLIVADALRPDRLGVAGYGRDTTPNLSRIAAARHMREAKDMRASCTASACGLFSLAASKYVHQFSWRPFTLHEVLRRHGYRVHLILGGDHIGFYGLRRIYGEVDSYFDGSMVPYEGSISTKYLYVNDDQFVVDKTAALPEWDGVPVMLQYHLMSTHGVSKRYERYARYKPSENYAFKRPGLSDNLEPARNYYDNGVVQADAIIDQLLETLGRKGYLRNAVVAITADHGEALGENGFFSHAHGVTEEELKIPLLTFAYGYEPAAGSFAALGPVSQVDIAPTLLAELGMPRPATWTGVPLQEPRRKDFSFFQQWHAAGLIDRRDLQNVWKFWVNGRTGAEFAFNLTRDPLARTNALGTTSLDMRREWRRRYLEITGATESTAETRNLILPVQNRD